MQNYFKFFQNFKIYSILKFIKKYKIHLYFLDSILLISSNKKLLIFNGF